MWLQRLQLENFRGFSDLELDLDRRVTLLIGVNGAGKTSVVDAIGYAATGAAAIAFGRRASSHLSDGDVRLGEDKCHVRAEFDAFTVALSYSGVSADTTAPSTEHVSASSLPPLLLLFKANRAVLKAPTPIGTHGRLTIRSKHPAWDDVVNLGFSSFELGEHWFREREDLENQERVRRRELDYDDPGLASVRAAIEAVLPGYSRPRVDRNRLVGPGRTQLVLTKNALEVDATMLSDGERSLFVLALTIARRLSLLDDESRAVERAATVVIDEIELHLHPKWQRQIVPALTNAFPSCQFVITTHSPQVIGSVDQSCLQILDGRAVYPTSVPTRGRDSNAILAEVMDVGERDAVFEEELRKVAEGLDSGDPDVARWIDEIAERWGDNDREVVRLRAAMLFRDL